MELTRLQLTDIHYNAEFNCFETKVTIRDGNEFFVYPVHINAPITAEFAVIARGLTQKARQKHKAKDRGLHLRYAIPGINETPAPLHAA